MGTTREIELARTGVELSGAAAAHAKLLRDVIRELGEVAREAADYLSVSQHEQIGSGSILHQKLRCAANLAVIVANIQ